ncbi:hypothetical protein [Nitrosophilus labii]|uniref:hypothetical protein n=1 Tax=Nitrosophilus labii TaxID=2706014 RepID=UPI001656D99B|nr:hypothetical protein [Nitrosophilus labii]
MKRKKEGVPDFIDKEYEILNYLSSEYVPKVCEKTEDYILMEYLKGYDFKEALRLNRKTSLLLGLKLSYFLDKKRVYHSQLGRYYHLIVSKDFKNIKALDFERAKVDTTQKNLLQIVGYYMRDFYPFLKEEIKIYKSDIDSGYERIVKKIMLVDD